jgi:hypothetical protein
VWFRTPPSSDIVIARIFFLFVLRLRTGNDLRDQADLASTRSVTTGSWFSVALALRARSWSWGSSSTRSKLSPLTERSGTPTLSSGISFPGWSVSLSSVFFPSYSPQKPKQKFIFRLDLVPATFLASRILSILCVDWICVFTLPIVAGYLCFCFLIALFLSLHTLVRRPSILLLAFLFAPTHAATLPHTPHPFPLIVPWSHVP